MVASIRESQKGERITTLGELVPAPPRPTVVRFADHFESPLTGWLPGCSDLTALPSSVVVVQDTDGDGRPDHKVRIIPGYRDTNGDGRIERGVDVMTFTPVDACKTDGRVMLAEGLDLAAASAEAAWRIQGTGRRE